MLRQKKYALRLPKLEYLDHIASKDGLKTNPAKFKAIQEWAQPTNLGELKSFLGMKNYYFKFVTFFAKIVAPIYRLLCQIVQ